MSAEKKTDFHVVNHSLPRRDGRVKVTGRAHLRQRRKADRHGVCQSAAQPLCACKDRFHRQVARRGTRPAFIASSPEMISTGSILITVTRSRITRYWRLKKFAMPASRWLR